MVGLVQRSAAAWRLLGSVWHLSDELDELSQWLCHDDSSVNIVLNSDETVTDNISVAPSVKMRITQLAFVQSVS